ncbi:MAG: hypothetical protein LUD84_04915, partial [Clostridiales bacterium]|nr:hypothetical protein [Clostridiales bacterium]
MYGYPIFKVGEVINKFGGSVLDKQLELVHPKVKITFPTRLNTLVLDQTKVVPNPQMLYPAGEVLISIWNPVIVEVSFLGNFDGDISITGTIKRRGLVVHAYHLMCQALNRKPSLAIYVDDSRVKKHVGLGSSGAIL